jgi:hypothetical protein
MDLRLTVAVLVVTTIPEFMILMEIITTIITTAQNEDVSEQSRTTVIKEGIYN